MRLSPSIANVHFFRHRLMPSEQRSVIILTIATAMCALKSTKHILSYSNTYTVPICAHKVINHLSIVYKVTKRIDFLNHRFLLDLVA